jgi:hypothetical protein
VLATRQANSGDLHLTMFEQSHVGTFQWPDFTGNIRIEFLCKVSSTPDTVNLIISDKEILFIARDYYEAIND